MHPDLQSVAVPTSDDIMISGKVGDPYNTGESGIVDPILLQFLKYYVHISGNMETETLRDLVGTEYIPYLDRIKVMCEAPYAVANGIELVSLTKESAKMRKVVRPDDLNSNGVAHGAVLFGLIDHTFAMAANVICDGVGQSCNIIYHRPVTGKVIETESRLINESRSLIIYDVRLFCDGKLCTSATCTGFKTKKE